MEGLFIILMALPLGSFGLECFHCEYSKHGEEEKGEKSCQMHEILLSPHLREECGSDSNLISGMAFRCGIFDGYENDVYFIRRQCVVVNDAELHGCSYSSDSQIYKELSGTIEGGFSGNICVCDKFLCNTGSRLLTTNNFFASLLILLQMINSVL